VEFPRQKTQQTLTCNRFKDEPSSGIDPLELLRLKAMTTFESEAQQSGYHTIAGVDEAGRGPLAGPVVAAACIIPAGLYIPGVNDSKKLSPKQRAALFERIINDSQIMYGIGIVDAQTIDKVNIYQATILAMKQALDALALRPDMLLVDGMPLSYQGIPAQKIIKGDSKSQSIAAASIIAKETRDAMMHRYDLQWPQYGFAKHKGYGTAFHMDAINQQGPCPIHRLTFEPIKSQLEGAVN
jgi:ribonuclease HII